jgi:very-short-patch-repair endonuclease
MSDASPLPGGERARVRGPPERTRFARRLRVDATRAEKLLWQELRGRRLDGWKFRRQEPIDRYVADFVCNDARLVIEIDGPGHQDRVEQDAARSAVIEAYGYRVLRIADSAVLDDLAGVLAQIRSEIDLARR